MRDDVVGFAANGWEAMRAERLTGGFDAADVSGR